MMGDRFDVLVVGKESAARLAETLRGVPFPGMRVWESTTRDAPPEGACAERSVWVEWPSETRAYYCSDSGLPMHKHVEDGVQHCPGQPRARGRALPITFMSLEDSRGRSEDAAGGIIITPPPPFFAGRCCDDKHHCEVVDYGHPMDWLLQERELTDIIREWVSENGLPHVEVMSALSMVWRQFWPTLTDSKMLPEMVKVFRDPSHLGDEALKGLASRLVMAIAALLSK